MAPWQYLQHRQTAHVPAASDVLSIGTTTNHDMVQSAATFLTSPWRGRPQFLATLHQIRSRVRACTFHDLIGCLHLPALRFAKTQRYLHTPVHPSAASNKWTKGTKRDTSDTNLLLRLHVADSDGGHEMLPVENRHSRRVSQGVHLDAPHVSISQHAKDNARE